MSTLSHSADNRTALWAALVAAAALGWLTGMVDLLREWAGTAEQAQSPSRPNILLLVADDLGYNDISAINATGISTPNIDRLAAAGALFTRHYADSTCTPSRVAMLSGRYAERSGFRPVGAEIPAEFPTLAESLQSLGYRTYLTGKWHAGEERRSAWPDHKGFERWFGFLNQFELSATAGDDAQGLHRPTYLNPMLRDNSAEAQRHSGHLTDILLEHSLERLAALRAQDQPWFLYHAFFAPHNPIQPAPRYRKRFEDTPEGAYRALVTQLDDAVGRLVDAVDPRDTLVIFVSDNGGTNVTRDNNFPFFGSKNEPFEGSYRTPLVLRWQGEIPAGTRIDDVVMNVDLYPTVMSAVGSAAPFALDGHDLLPLMRGGAPPPSRVRGWETYSSNVDALSYSFLSPEGDWRLASPSGLQPKLYHLARHPAGDLDVAGGHPQTAATLSDEFWRDHWHKSELPLAGEPGDRPGQTLYRGFDAMRTPFRHGFAIGLEIGPLPQAVQRGGTGEAPVLAGQDGHWELRYSPGHGIAWHMAGTVLEDASFDPDRCNAIVLTGYLQPVAHLDTRAPKSPLKLYNGGALQDIRQDLPASSLPPAEGLAAPTYVNFDGRAIFSNMVLGSFSDPYSPRVHDSYHEFYEAAHREHSLALAHVSMMDRQLCRSSP